MTGAELITAERQRQMSEKNWTAEHDDAQTDGQLLECAILIANDVYCDDLKPEPSEMVGDGGWPLQKANHIIEKYGSSYVNRLTIAGALIAAEIDRLQRVLDRQTEGES